MSAMGCALLEIQSRAIEFYAMSESCCEMDLTGGDGEPLARCRSCFALMAEGRRGVSPLRSDELELTLASGSAHRYVDAKRRVVDEWLYRHDSFAMSRRRLGRRHRHFCTLAGRNGHLDEDRRMAV